MFLMRFTERAYVDYSEEDVRQSFRSAVRLTFPNSHFNPTLGADLYNTYLDEYEYAEAVGFDGLMLNEHHNTPTCMGAAMNLEAAILPEPPSGRRSFYSAIHSRFSIILFVWPRSWQKSI